MQVLQSQRNIGTLKRGSVGDGSRIREKAYGCKRTITSRLTLGFFARKLKTLP
jgi:hypothetical protein